MDMDSAIYELWLTDEAESPESFLLPPPAISRIFAPSSTENVMVSEQVNNPPHVSSGEVDFNNVDISHRPFFLQSLKQGKKVLDSISFKTHILEIFTSLTDFTGNISRHLEELIEYLETYEDELLGNVYLADECLFAAWFACGLTRDSVGMDIVESQFTEYADFEELISDHRMVLGVLLSEVNMQFILSESERNLIDLEDF
jgi:hypothetical protein